MTHSIRLTSIALALLLNGCVSEPNQSPGNARLVELPPTEQRILQTGNLHCRRIGDINGPIYTVDGYPCPNGFFEVSGNQ